MGNNNDHSNTLVSYSNQHSKSTYLPALLEAKLMQAGEVDFSRLGYGSVSHSGLSLTHLGDELLTVSRFWESYFNQKGHLRGVLCQLG